MTTVTFPTIPITYDYVTDFVGSDGYGWTLPYRGDATRPVTLFAFLSDFMTEIVNEKAAIAAINGLAPGANLNVPVSNGAAWVARILTQADIGRGAVLGTTGNFTGALSGLTKVSTASTVAQTAAAAATTGVNFGFDSNTEHGWLQATRNSAAEPRSLDINPLGGAVTVGNTLTVAAGLTVTAGGITVSAGASAFQALTGTTIATATGTTAAAAGGFATAIATLATDAIYLVVGQSSAGDSDQVIGIAYRRSGGAGANVVALNAAGDVSLSASGNDVRVNNLDGVNARTLRYAYIRLL
jgi:hypothetical protein